MLAADSSTGWKLVSQYIEDVTGAGRKDDPRVLGFDIMNEPSRTGWSLLEYAHPVSSQLTPIPFCPDHSRPISFRRVTSPATSDPTTGLPIKVFGCANLHAMEVETAGAISRFRSLVSGFRPSDFGLVGRTAELLGQLYAQFDANPSA